ERRPAFGSLEESSSGTVVTGPIGAPPARNERFGAPRRRSRIERSAICSVCVGLERCDCRRGPLSVPAPALVRSRLVPLESEPEDSSMPDVGDGGGRTVRGTKLCRPWPPTHTLLPRWRHVKYSSVHCSV